MSFSSPRRSQVQATCYRFSNKSEIRYFFFHFCQNENRGVTHINTHGYHSAALMGCFFSRNPLTWVPFSTRISLNIGPFTKICSVHMLKMGTFFCQNDPLKRVGVSRLEQHTSVQTKSEYPQDENCIQMTTNRQPHSNFHVSWEMQLESQQVLSNTFSTSCWSWFKEVGLRGIFFRGGKVSFPNSFPAWNVIFPGKNCPFW